MSGQHLPAGMSSNQRLAAISKPVTFYRQESSNPAGEDLEPKELIKTNLGKEESLQL